MKNYIEYVFFRLFQIVVQLIPWGFYNCLSKFISIIIFILFDKRREIAMQNIKNAFPNLSNREIVILAKKSFQSVTITGLEVLSMHSWNKSKISSIIKLTNPEALDFALQKGNGVILIGGHYANWELIISCCTLLHNKNMSIVVQEQRNKFVDNKINNLRTQFGNKTIKMDKAPKQVLQELKENKIVAMLGDQSGKEDGLYVNFFGRLASTHKGPAIFAIRSGASLLFMQNIRFENGKYELTLKNIPYDEINSNKENAISILTQRITTTIENHIREFPTQWLWMHKRWKHLQNNLE